MVCRLTTESEWTNNKQHRETVMNHSSRWILGLLAACTLLTGCEKEKEEPTPPKPAATPACADCNWDQAVAEGEMRVTNLHCTDGICHQLETKCINPKRTVLITRGTAANTYTFELATPRESAQGFKCENLVVGQNPTELTGKCLMNGGHGHMHDFVAKVGRLENSDKIEVSFFFNDTGGNTGVHNGEGHTHKPD